MEDGVSVKPIRAFVLVVAVLASACSAAHTDASAPRSSGSSGSFAPAPDAFIPKDPSRLARVLAKTTWALRVSVQDWTEQGDPSSGKAPRVLRLQALYQQRIYRFLAQRGDVARRTIEALPGWVRGEAKADVAAGELLFSLVHPVKHHPPIRVQEPKAAGVLRGFYGEAERRFSVSWRVLAAVNYVESKFGRVVSNSSAGAQGPMQFIPSTWRAYGMGGDVHDDHDAILGAANYLRASGAPSSYRNALYAYNHSHAYVDAVLLYAKRMQADPRAYFEYYNWQVFVRTKYGYKQLTGPGA
jgi:hypothetical protein